MMAEDSMWEKIRQQEIDRYVQWELYNAIAGVSGVLDKYYGPTSEDPLGQYSLLIRNSLDVIRRELEPSIRAKAERKMESAVRQGVRIMLEQESQEKDNY